MFQKKQYILGTFDCLEDAAAARRRGEEFLRDEVLSYYEKWQKRADADPQWAKENPIRIYTQKNNGSFAIELLPILKD